MRRVILAATVGAALLFGAPESATAQQNQWRITPFFGGAIYAGPTEFENTFALGASVMRRLGKVGVEVQTYFTPTSLADIIERFPPVNPGDVTGDPNPQSTTFGADQNMLFTSANLTLFNTSWQPNRPPPRTEWYAVAGAGFAMFMDEHPADPRVWEAGTKKLLLSAGGGVQFNLNRRTSIQLELRETAFQHLERWSGDTKWHNNITLRQGITLIR